MTRRGPFRIVIVRKTSRFSHGSDFRAATVTEEILFLFLTVCFPFINEVSIQQIQHAANLLLLPHSSTVTSVHRGIFHSNAGRRGLDRIKAAQRLFI